ncbi:TPA: RloB family protein [Pseudomonas aeruginosa]|uniref:RloB family protein n=1 Tax=Pseudomonas aeruginosa TaxID=287 RepID=UPI00093EA82A|nr:RloB family protein [Pseudomonas aeruginosa]MBA5357140.1 RloB domain-containing protein [Pseudomonas aeruginosa]MBG5722129.1 RloB domain-containing protein [Pseudomonas aeruginosa]MBG7431897.1 RloB domain-containing protein [Pseudomonas aeruginosa]MBX5522890.1 RloB domain-containing protein [Pseudomonas aeruginosa]MBX5688245.1 RloB domain-containing protein [Pseudomonas aeruginosa]
MNLRQRKENTKPIKKKVLIVCEGARTEPNYFKSFRVYKDCHIVGSGSNTLSVVKEAIRLKKENSYSEAWCVFDRDSFPASRVKAALNLAERNNIKCAFSNESFELWYVLHFEYLDTQITRADYCKKLTNLLGKKYEKNNASIYEEILDRQDQALKFAKKLEKKILPNGACPANSYPYTTVYKIVERLNKLAKP